MQPTDAQTYLYQRLIGLGWKPGPAQAMVNSVSGESGPHLNTGQQGSTATENGGVLGPAAYGIANWNGDRQAKLQDFADKNGLPVNSLDTQARFIDHEARHDYPDTAERITDNSSSPGTLTQLFTNNYLVPADKSIWKKRADAGPDFTGIDPNAPLPSLPAVASVEPGAAKAPSASPSPLGGATPSSSQLATLLAKVKADQPGNRPGLLGQLLVGQGGINSWDQNAKGGFGGLGVLGSLYAALSGKGNNPAMGVAQAAPGQPQASVSQPMTVPPSAPVSTSPLPPPPQAQAQPTPPPAYEQPPPGMGWTGAPPSFWGAGGG